MRPLYLIPFLAIAACSQTNEAPEAPISESETTLDLTALPDLEQIWVTSGFSSPEGVATDGEILFISNVSGEGEAKDGDGWITRLAMDGSVLEKKWVEGLNAPKGLGLRDGKLFVSDYDAYHVIDVATATIENTYPVEGAGFLNDITIWQNDVYLSDSRTARVFQIDENGYKEWLADERLRGVNGLTPDGDRLLIATMASGSLFETTGDGTLTEIATGMENADGVAVLDDGGYLVSSWPGQLWYASPDGQTMEIHNTVEVPIFQNDLTRVGDMIIVPNWQPGTVTAWRLKD